MRGDQAGSFEAAHRLAHTGQQDWGPVQAPETGVYDLIVVGAGISGLATAWFYRQQHRGARILILDNHDDFGGHARRNEFQVGGNTLLGYGGSQSLEAPSGYPRVVKRLLHDLGVNRRVLEQAYDQTFYRRHGLTAGIYFDKQHWNSRRLLRYDFGLFSYLPLASAPLSAFEAVARMPVSPAARGEFLHLLHTSKDQIPDIPGRRKLAYLETISYRQFLEQHLGISEPDVFAVLQNLSSDSGVGIEATPASEALTYNGLPGWDAAGLPDIPEEPYIDHFPDGNASIARLLVRALIPGVASGRHMDDVVTAQFDYGRLDQQEAPVRLRLNATAMQVANVGNPKTASAVDVTYLRAGQAFRVRGRACVLACYNAMIPYLCPQMPAAQREALAYQVKVPILYTNVALNNWRAWKNSGVGAVASPSSYHVVSMLDFPVSMGNYHFSADPDEPIIVHMERFFHRSNSGLSPAEQHRLGRQELLSTSFVQIEREVRNQLTGMLSPTGFDPVNDIAGITVNRWGHGYTRWYNPLFDTVYDDDDDPRYPHMRARKPFGRIAIANADAGARALLPTAVEQAHRAVSELIG